MRDATPPLQHRALLWGLASTAWLVAAILAICGAALLSTIWLADYFLPVGIGCLVAAFALSWIGGLTVSKQCWASRAAQRART